MLSRLEAAVILLLVTTSTLLAVETSDKYTEELVVTRLGSGELLSQLRFVVTTKNTGSDYDLFPRVIGELNQKYDLDEWHLTMARGFWRAEDWGVAPQPPASTGTTLDVWFGGNTTNISKRWASLVSELNGVFCVSLLDLKETLVVQPQLTQFPTGLHSQRDPARRRLGNAARESPCTENLTPWRGLLPCRQYGLTSILNPLKVYASNYHSMSLHVYKACEIGEAKKCVPEWRLDLIADIVHPRDLKRKSLDWSLTSLFGRQLNGHCDVAETSVLLVEHDYPELELKPSPNLTFGRQDGRVFSYYNLKTMKVEGSSTWDLSADYGQRHLGIVDSAYGTSLASVHSWLSEVDQVKGALHTRIRNNDSRPLRAIYAHAIPWYIRLYYHTLRVRCGGIGEDVTKEPTKIVSRNFVAAHDSGRPALIELEFILPTKSDCFVDVNFDKAFMRMSDYPSDAHRGLDVPAASVSLAALDKVSRLPAHQNRSSPGTPRCTALQEFTTTGQPKRAESQEKATSKVKTSCDTEWTVVYGEPLVVVLPVPDFSMPYNVLCLVATVFSLAYSPIFSYSTQVMVPLRWQPFGASPARKFTRVILLGLIVVALYGHFTEKTLTDMTKEVGKWLEKMNTIGS